MPGRNSSPQPAICQKARSLASGCLKLLEGSGRSANLTLAKSGQKSAHGRYFPKVFRSSVAVNVAKGN